MAVSITGSPHQPEEPSEEAIARLAFSYWEARGRQGGSAEEDWFTAEQELKRQAATTKPGS